MVFLQSLKALFKWLFFEVLLYEKPFKTNFQKEVDRLQQLCRMRASLESGLLWKGLKREVRLYFLNDLKHRQLVDGKRNFRIKFAN